MSFKLTYELGGQTFERDAEPTGRFSIIETWENHRYREELSGEMTFKGDDYDFIIAAGDCTAIYVTCEWRKTFRGVFTHTDCTTINRSKRYIEVIPRTDDLYSKFEPYMDLELNIIPPYGGIKTNTFVGSVNQYETERKVVRIDEPYDGENAENWQGYSVNDWIKNTKPPGGYGSEGLVWNSLIWKIMQRQLFLNIEYTALMLIGGQYMLVTWSGYGGFLNNMLWQDYTGYEMKEILKDEQKPLTEQVVDRREALRRMLSVQFDIPELFTLVEVVNYYDENKWDYCELIYEREVYKGFGKPRGIIDPAFEQMYDAVSAGEYKTYQDFIKNNEMEFFKFSTPETNVIVKGFAGKPVNGWIYNYNDKIWVRRPLNIGAEMLDAENYEDLSLTEQEKNVAAYMYGDGTWFTPLIEREFKGKKVKMQWMYHNRKYAIDYGDNWYFELYGNMLIGNRFQRIDKIFQKFIQYIKDEGMELGDLELQSQHLTAETHPHTNEENDWALTLVGQNSDIKRPLSSEAATKEDFSLKRFLDTICDISNAAWAVLDVDGTPKLVIEHIKYFEQGLTYDDDIPVINPNSIFNVAKNKGFMNLTDRYNYDKSMMPQFEKFETIGGEEPVNNNTLIQYKSPCVNTKPRENTTDVRLDTTTDYTWVRTEGDDRGITLVRMLAKLEEPPSISLLESYGIIDNDTQNALSFTPLYDFYDVYIFTPQRKVYTSQYYRYIYNRDFTLEDIIRLYHDWGRSYKYAELNSVEFGSLNVPLVPKHNIVQNVAFPFRTDKNNTQEIYENPYAHVVTNLGIGMIRRREHVTKTGLLELELGLREVDPVTFMDVHEHNQEEASSIWDIKHEMGTDVIMRPIVFKQTGGEWEEIEYNEFLISSNRRMRLEFTKAITGKAYFLSLRTPSKFIYKGYGEETWTINHNLDVDDKYIVFSAVLENDGQREVKYNSLEYVDKNTIEIKFSRPVTGEITIADVTGYTWRSEINIDGNYVNIQRASASQIVTKPIVLEVGKEIEYQFYRLISDSLKRIGFTKEVIAKIIVTRK